MYIKPIKLSKECEHNFKGPDGICSHCGLKAALRPTPKRMPCPQGDGMQTNDKQQGDDMQTNDKLDDDMHTNDQQGDDMHTNDEQGDDMHTNDKQGDDNESDSDDFELEPYIMEQCRNIQEFDDEDVYDLMYTKMKADATIDLVFVRLLFGYS